ncbi:MAG: hypothetical protein SFV51_18535 [Bryobacteraceae bacterium]|nr:hypothetical protein [Bryobacteraceae bacterium]
MMPLALDLISTFVTGSTLPVATTDLARSMRWAFASFSAGIFGVFVEIAFSEKKAAAAKTGSMRKAIHRILRFPPRAMEMSASTSMVRSRRLGSSPGFESLGKPSASATELLLNRAGMEEVNAVAEVRVILHFRIEAEDRAAADFHRHFFYGEEVARSGGALHLEIASVVMMELLQNQIGPRQSLFPPNGRLVDSPGW